MSISRFCWYQLRLVEVTIRHHHLLKCNHSKTVIAPMYVVSPVCSLFFVKIGTRRHINILKITISKWPRLDWLDNGFYSTIQPPTHIPHILWRLEYGRLYWNSLIHWAKNWSRLHNKILNQLVQKLTDHHWIRSSSPVTTNPSGILMYVNVT